jgi:hypothetical protein
VTVSAACVNQGETAVVNQTNNTSDWAVALPVLTKEAESAEALDREDGDADGQHNSPSASVVVSHLVAVAVLVRQRDVVRKSGLVPASDRAAAIKCVLQRHSGLVERQLEAAGELVVDFSAATIISGAIDLGRKVKRPRGAALRAGFPRVRILDVRLQAVGCVVSVLLAHFFV